ncbi:unnamed protein product [Dibothriocephalus latus]|uniref:Dynein heavy chain tail domain-containing protein n=1 Tax=Dibothriocephalus latus TaxID=60516 RepID=A0A3P7NFQ5_DIBLA|nr:unnamed protein product [Dibothriocephalus latus]
MIWTHDATEALDDAKDNPKLLVDTNRNFLLLLELLISQTTRPLSKYARTKYETLITIHLHQKDIFDALVSQNCQKPGWNPSGNFTLTVFAFTPGVCGTTK